ncbi:hypothetical protein [Microbacterium sp. W4I20]|uniref:hypothetical protein n=1 Tax=Microbacterium sp. W4I20 TaxID=3042262 RepID=UPI002782B754|nr:hypothetical protein [Microbacterium sp. W4I20]MDQ0726803.1 hypothetical protein [Microbacterium sp. W4I20]
MAITLLTDVTAAPFVEVFVDDLIPEAAWITVYRLAGGREFLMRGAVRAPTAGAFTRIDFEIPFNIPVTYRAELFDAAGESLGFTESATTTLICADTWMHNPLNPSGGVKVFFGEDRGWSVTRPTPGVVSRPLGRRVGVVLSEPRYGVTGLDMVVRTSTDEDADKVQAMMGDNGMPPIVCIRLGSNDGRLRLPQPLFLSALSVTEMDMDHRWGGSELAHSLSGDEVDPPIPGLFVPLLTRADLNAFYATRAALNADNLLRLDVNRRYDLAGTAG